MKLTKKFGAWVGQILALLIMIFRAEMLVELVKLIPHADVSQLYPVIGALAVIIVLWVLWLVRCGIKGFSGEMNFLFDARDRRW